MQHVYRNDNGWVSEVNVLHLNLKPTYPCDVLRIHGAATSLYVSFEVLEIRSRERKLASLETVWELVDHLSTVALNVALIQS